MFKFLRTHFPAFFSHPLSTELSHAISEKRRQLIQAQLLHIKSAQEIQRLHNQLNLLAAWKQSIERNEETVLDTRTGFESVGSGYNFRSQFIQENSSNPETLRPTRRRTK